MTAFQYIATGLSVVMMGFAAPFGGGTENMHTLENLHKSASTGEWLATAVTTLKKGDHVSGDVLRQFVDPLDFEGGEDQIEELLAAVEYLEVDKAANNKLVLRTFLKDKKNIQRQFICETGKNVKLELRHKKTRLFIERLGMGKVMLKIKGIGASYAGAPVPESLVRMVVHDEEIELVEVMSYEIDQGQSITLPKAFQLPKE